MATFIQVTIYTTLISYAAGAALYFTGSRCATRKGLWTAFVVAAVGFISNTMALILRTIMVSRLPLSSGYEFILIFTCITVGFYLVYELKTGEKGAGAIAMLMAALLILSVVLMAQGQFGEVTPLMPALKSPWLTVHVLTAATAYACFAITAGLAARQLISTSTNIVPDSAYKFAATGFALLSLSIILGAVWAEQAWGSYWSWDPKEVWALFTWIIYAVYLHLHRSNQLKGSSASILLLAGFALVLFTFFGVNYLLPGMHSYAGFIEDTAMMIS